MLSDTTDISAGVVHSARSMGNGSVECWALDADGELGDGTTTSSPSPVIVGGAPPGNVALAVSVGGHDSCALLANRTVVCWGANLNGQLGNGTSASSSTPVTVSGLKNVAAIRLATTTRCAVGERDGNRAIRYWLRDA